MQGGIQNWLPLRGRWLRYFWTGMGVVTILLFVTPYGQLALYGLAWMNRPLWSLGEVERSSKVRFPRGSHFVRGYAQGIFRIHATIEIPRSSVETFLAQSDNTIRPTLEFHDLERKPGLITGISGHGWVYSRVQIRPKTETTAIVDFYWQCDD